MPRIMESDRGAIRDYAYSIRNRCDIISILLDEELEWCERLLPTVIEDLFEDSQSLVLDYCVKESRGTPGPPGCDG